MSPEPDIVRDDDGSILAVFGEGFHPRRCRLVADGRTVAATGAASGS